MLNGLLLIVSHIQHTREVGFLSRKIVVVIRIKVQFEAFLAISGRHASRFGRLLEVAAANGYKETHKVFKTLDGGDVDNRAYSCAVACAGSRDHFHRLDIL